MAYFQLPDNRVLEAPESGLQTWPDDPGGFRLFVEGTSGPERIGIHLNQSIELELVGGKDCFIETIEGHVARSVAVMNRRDSRDIETEMNGPVDVAVHVASTDPAKLRIAGGDKQRFTLRAKHAGTTKIFAYEAGGAERASLEIVVGSFEKHDSFPADLISDICRGSDSLKIHALQRMLHNRWLHGDVYTNGDNVFEQNSSSNLHNDPD